MADRLAEDGWKELGYEYVIIDDCWMSMVRDEQGKLQPEPSRLVFCSLPSRRSQRPETLQTEILKTFYTVLMRDR